MSVKYNCLQSLLNSCLTKYVWWLIATTRQMIYYKIHQQYLDYQTIRRKEKAFIYHTFIKTRSHFVRKLGSECFNHDAGISMEQNGLRASLRVQPVVVWQCWGLNPQTSNQQHICSTLITQEYI